MKSSRWVIVAVVTLSFADVLLGGDGKKESQEQAGKQDEMTEQVEKEELKLEDLFPEKSLFGPAAGWNRFSHDSKLGAFLYRPYRERRHGDDLHIYDVEKGQVRRITWASVMARFQKNTREVVEDRIEKAKKDQSEQKDEAGDEKAAEDPNQNKEKKSENTKDHEGQRDGQKLEERLKERGDWVSDKDADDEKAPRYEGINQYAWSPASRELIFESQGDLYRYIVDEDRIVRLTQSLQKETSFTWLPDGKGYVYRDYGALMRVLFDDSVTRQLDPKFPNKDRLFDYSISPDGRCVVFVTYKQTKAATSSTVEIASYRDRLMKAREQNRHISDDPLPEHERRVYIYQISEEPDEQDTLTEVFTFKSEMPDDKLETPVWSPDSRKVAFFTFKYDTAMVRIYEASLPEPPEESTSDDDEKKGEDPNEAPDPNQAEKQKSPEPQPAQEIHRFSHQGGPRTPRMMKLYYLADNHHIVYLSEQTGFRHLHRLDPLYQSIRPLTRGSFEVYPFGISKDRKWIFVMSTKEHPSQTDLYRVSTKNGRMIRLTKEKGTHSRPAISPDGNRVLCNFASYNKLKELVFADKKTGVYKTLTDSHPDKAHGFAEGRPEFFDYTNRHGHRLYGMMIKPEQWTAQDKRPVLIHFYGGPLGEGQDKRVVQGSFHSDVFMFPYYMAQKHGYVTCTIDTRGNSGYAGVFEKANFEKIGQPQVEDLVDGVKVLVKHYGVDPNRVAIHGWSFGGFQTQKCMYTEPSIFQVGIAGAGPTEWENYYSGYTFNTVGKSEPGKATLKEFSLLPLAKNLKGHLLLVHGMEDSTVLYQDTVHVYRELLKAGKETQVELFLDPTGGHGLGGDIKRLGRYRKYEQFLLRTIGAYSEKGAPAEESKAKPAKKLKRKGKSRH